MKKTALTVAILSVLGTLAYAGTAAVSGKEMQQVAPAPPPCCDWSGGYVGLFGGYKFSVVDTNLDLSGLWDSLDLERFHDFHNRVESAGSQDLDNDGGELGGLVGYNWQFGCWVLGVEAAGGYLWAKDSNTTPVIPSNTMFPDAEVRTSFKTEYLFTFAPKFGYAFGNFLPYVTAGLAVGDLIFQQNVRLIFEGQGERFGHGTEGGEDSENRAGWMVGGGLQYCLTAHWSVRAQYQYIDFGSEHFVSTFGGPFGNITEGGPLHDFPAHSDVELREHNASVAIMYKF
jgi:outer membrane immunogenic protein